MRAASTILGGISPTRSAMPTSSRPTRSRSIRPGSTACESPYSRSRSWMATLLRHFSWLSLTVRPSQSTRDATICTWLSAWATTT